MTFEELTEHIYCQHATILSVLQIKFRSPKRSITYLKRSLPSQDQQATVRPRTEVTLGQSHHLSKNVHLSRISPSAFTCHSYAMNMRP